jgi:hypothetical protein
MMLTTRKFWSRFIAVHGNIDLTSIIGKMVAVRHKCYRNYEYDYEYGQMGPLVDREGPSLPVGFFY